MGPVTHIVRNSDLQTDPLIRLDNLGSRSRSWNAGFVGKGSVFPHGRQSDNTFSIWDRKWT